MSPKETNYFAFAAGRGRPPLYGDPELHHFPVRTLPEYESLFAGAGDATAIGEASPIYLGARTAERIRRLLPNARIVCGLRDPVDRAYSDYLMYRRSRGCGSTPGASCRPTPPGPVPTPTGCGSAGTTRCSPPTTSRSVATTSTSSCSTTSDGVCGRRPRRLAFVGVDPAFEPDVETPHNIGGVPSNMAMERVLTSHALRRVAGPLVPARAANWARRVDAEPPEGAPAAPGAARRADRGVPRRHPEDLELVGRDLGAWSRPPRNVRAHVTTRDGVDVVFIGGASRTGSTLLSLLLGSPPGTSPPARCATCGCGAPGQPAVRLRRAVPLVPPLAGGDDDGARPRRRPPAGALHGPVEADRRPARRAPIARPDVEGLGAARREYLDVLRRVYLALGRVTGGEVVVDSSKYATDCLLLSSCRGSRARDPSRARQPGRRVLVATEEAAPEIHWRDQDMMLMSPPAAPSTGAR